MSDYIKENANYFDDFDFDNAKPIKHPLIAKAQTNIATTPNVEVLNFFDDDVLEIIKHHNTDEHRLRVNAVLRALFLTA